MTNLVKTMIFAASLAMGTQAVQAATVVIDFDGIATGDFVNGFYAGGTSSGGGSGTNFGITFADFQTTTGFGETSEPNLAYVSSGQGLIDVAPGFSTSLSFTAGFFSSGTLSIWSGLGGTGTLLASSSGILGNPSAFTLNSIAFAGTAYSVTLVAAPGSVALDDVTFNLGSAVPEAATWSLMIIGFGLVGATMRRRVHIAA